MGYAKTEIEKFFWNFCDNYIEIAKNRLYKPEVYGEEAKQSAQWACYNVLLGCLKVFAITLPHITEEIYQDYFRAYEGEESIHLTVLAPITVDDSDNIIACGDEVVEIVSKIRQFKSENKISMKTQIESLDIASHNAEFVSSVDYDIKAVGGIQNLTTQTGESNLIFGAIVPDEQ